MFCNAIGEFPSSPPCKMHLMFMVAHKTWRCKYLQQQKSKNKMHHCLLSGITTSSFQVTSQHSRKPLKKPMRRHLHCCFLKSSFSALQSRHETTAPKGLKPPDRRRDTSCSLRVKAVNGLKVEVLPKIE